MPRPKGWTSADEALRDECVESVKPGSVRNPYAVCTAMVQKHKKDGNPADVIAAAKSLMTRLAKVFV